MFLKSDYWFLCVCVFGGGIVSDLDPAVFAVFPLDAHEHTHTHMRKSNENNSVIFHSSLIGVCRQIQHCVCFLNEGTSYAAIMERLKDTERQ